MFHVFFWYYLLCLKNFFLEFLLETSLLFLFLLNVYFLRENVRRGWGRERGQRIWSELCTESSEPDVTLELMSHEIKTWAEVRLSTDWATQVPPSMTLIARKQEESREHRLTDGTETLTSSQRMKDRHGHSGGARAPRHSVRAVRGPRPRGGLSLKHPEQADPRRQKVA